MFIIFSILALGDVIFHFWLSGISGILSILVQLTLFGGVYLLVLLTYVVYTKKWNQAYGGIFIRFCTYLLGIEGVFLIAFGFFSYYWNEISPASLSFITLKNKDRTLYIQEMSHIAKSDFYACVRNNYKNHTLSGSFIYYEGVRPGTPENLKYFHNLLGINLRTDTYGDIAGILQLESQNYITLFGNDFERISKNVDISIDDIVRMSKEKYSSGSIGENDNPIDIHEYVELFNNFTENEKRIFRYGIHALLNTLGSVNIDAIENIPVFSIILNERNKIIATEIQNDVHKNIYATYGALHSNGIIHELISKDQNWEIKEISSCSPY